MDTAYPVWRVVGAPCPRIQIGPLSAALRSTGLELHDAGRVADTAARSPGNVVALLDKAFTSAHSRLQFILYSAAVPNMIKTGIICLWLAFAGAVFSAPAADAPAPPQPASTNDASSSNDALRAYLQIQEQLHETQLAIERIRQESADATARNAEAFTNRLRAMEHSLTALADQRARDFDAMQATTRYMLTILSIFAAVGFVAVLLAAFFQWRTVNRIAEISATLPAQRALGLPPGGSALELTQVAGGPAGAVERSSGRLLGVIDRLEKRILELENAANSHPVPTTIAENGKAAVQTPPLEEKTDVAPAPEIPVEARIANLLEKGQSLLNLDRAEEALVCFEEALRLDGANAESLVKKGVALETLRRPQEAIECYDRAIAVNDSLTIAYLHKGGLCNRLERFDEAMECYERALRTQEKRRSN